MQYTLRRVEKIHCAIVLFDSQSGRQLNSCRPETVIQRRLCPHRAQNFVPFLYLVPQLGHFFFFAAIAIMITASRITANAMAIQIRIQSPSGTGQKPQREHLSSGCLSATGFSWAGRSLSPESAWAPPPFTSRTLDHSEGPWLPVKRTRSFTLLFSSMK